MARPKYKLPGWMMADAVPHTVKYPRSTPTFGKRLHPKMRQWVIQQVDMALQKNPAQIPSKGLAEKSGLTATHISRLAQARRRKHGIQVNAVAGGARIKVTGKPVEIISRLYNDARENRRPLEWSDIHDALVAGTRSAKLPGYTVSKEAISRIVAELNSAASQRGLETVELTKGTLLSAEKKGVAAHFKATGVPFRFRKEYREKWTER